MFLPQVARRATLVATLDQYGFQAIMPVFSTVFLALGCPARGYQAAEALTARPKAMTPYTRNANQQ